MVDVVVFEELFGLGPFDVAVKIGDRLVVPACLLSASTQLVLDIFGVYFKRFV